MYNYLLGEDRFPKTIVTGDAAMDEEDTRDLRFRNLNYRNNWRIINMKSIMSGDVSEI